MPWLSPSASPDGSPRSRSAPALGNSGAMRPPSKHNAAPPPSTLMITTASRTSRATAVPSVTYIPQLIDGACGTMPHSQRSVLQRLSNDLSSAARLLPALVQAAVVARVNVFEMAQHVGLALLEVCILLSAVPLWLCCPGVLFAAWLGFCSALVTGASWLLNGGRGATRGTIVRSPPPAADGWMAGPDVDHERWFYVGGMGMSARSLTQTTLPALSKLFNRSIEAVHAPTYGLPVDFLIFLLQRCLSVSFPTTTHSRALYAQIRTALLDQNCARTIILAHNAGAVTVAQVLHQLYADIPADKMEKLEIYTFGAAAADFSIPLGGVILPSRAETMAMMSNGKKKSIGSNSSSSSSEHYSGYHQQQQQQQVHAPQWVATRQGPHIEHFAFTNDPFAKMGVLRSVHEDLEGRFCGSVFELDCPGAAHHGDRLFHHPKTARSGPPLLMSLSDYMACLFPEHARPTGSSSPSASSPSASLSVSSTSSPRSRRQRRHHFRHHGQEADDDNHLGGSKTGSILDNMMHIDRDLAEKREFAALAQHSASIRSKGGKKRLSWTGLGATAGAPANGNMDGVVGLEMARKGCRECQGHRGRDVSRLAGYVNPPAFEVDQDGDREEGQHQQEEEAAEEEWGGGDVVPMMKMESSEMVMDMDAMETRQ